MLYNLLDVQIYIIHTSHFMILGRVTVFVQVTFHMMAVRYIACIIVAIATQNFCQDINRTLIGSGVGSVRNLEAVVGGDGDIGHGRGDGGDDDQDREGVDVSGRADSSPKFASSMATATETYWRRE